MAASKTSFAIADLLGAVSSGIGAVARSIYDLLFKRSTCPEDFGAAGDGTDDSAAFTRMLAAIQAGSVSSNVRFDSATYRINSQIVFPNDGATRPKQRSMRWIGAGCSHNGQGGTALGGTIIDLRYAGRSASDGATTNNSATLTSATANFTAADVGLVVTGAGIPLNTTILTLVSPTNVTLSANATSTATGVTITVLSPKILTLGLGTLEIEGVHFKDDSTANPSPFIYTTNTTLLIHHNGFTGNPGKVGTTCDQDAIILGGPTTNLDAGTAAGPFQGYGTVIRENFFNRIRQTVWLRAFANAVVIRDNNIWNSCGGDTNYAAINVTGYDAGNVDAGCIIEGNLIEMSGYAYGIRLAQAVNFTFGPNNFYDPTVVTQAFVRFETTAKYCLVIAGYHSDSYTFVSDAGNFNSWLNPHQNQNSTWGQPFTFTNELSTSFSGQGIINKTAAGDLFYPVSQYNSGTGFASQQLRFTPSGGSNETIVDFQRNSSSQYTISAPSTATTSFTLQNTAGDLKTYSKAGNTLWLGDSSKQVTITNGILTASRGITAGKQTLTYGTTVAVAPGSGAYMLLTVTNGTAFTINTPSSATNGQEITFEIANASGGALGTVTWTSGAGGYKLAGAWVSPANGTSRTITFKYNATNWVEISRSASDIS